MNDENADVKVFEDWKVVLWIRLKIIEDLIEGLAAKNSFLW